LWAAYLVSCFYPARQGFALEQEALDFQARVFLERGQTAEALLTFHKAIASRKPDDTLVPELLDEVAELEYSAGRLSDAERSAARVLAIRKRTLGPNHPSVATSMNNLGEVLFAEGRYKEAEMHYRGALDLAEHETPPDPGRQAKFLANLGKLLTARHKDRDASQALSRALNLWTTQGNTVEQAVTLGNMALLMIHRGQYAEAEEMCNRALKRLDRDHPNAIAASINLAEILRIRTGMTNPSACSSRH
jgi:tetratricopeptide (TPR) repeat protein